MPEREREILTAPPSPDHLARRAAQGWRIHAIEWERDTAAADSGGQLREQVPYGMRVSGDCQHLEEDPVEVETMMTIMEGIVEDRPLSQIATELSRRGSTTRDGRQWSQVLVFHLLPRLIEFSPRFLSRPEWLERRRALKLVG
jgi:hypothetical protein